MEDKQNHNTVKFVSENNNKNHKRKERFPFVMQGEIVNFAGTAETRFLRVLCFKKHIIFDRKIKDAK